MSDSLVNITINGQQLKVKKGTKLIEAAAQSGCEIPRFCYHPDLKVVASCRMCLVDIEGAAKPQPSCSLDVQEGMVVKTSSEKAINAQKSVMRFLLMKHPLHCPICDQGGQCELQDVAMGYGEGITDFVEEKRDIDDEDLGHLVATDMSLCIHCTRCVRFGEEIAGIKELGLIGRSDDAKVSTYLEKGLKSEWSGNMIDLCPVGALTSKPAKFAGRSWSYKSHFGIAPFDGMGAHLAYHTMYKGYQGIHQLKRVVPESCSHLNHIWLSDRDRFGYEAIEHNRVLTPLLRVGNKLEPISYEQAFKVLSDHFSRLSDQQKERSAVIVSPQTASEVGVKIATLFRKMDMHHIDIGTHQSLYSPDVALVPASAEPEEIEQAQTILLIGTALRWEQPYLSLRVQKAQENGAKVLSLGSIKHHYNFPVEHKMASAQHLIHDAMVLLNEWGVCQHHQDWSKDLTQSRVVVLVGDEALSHPQAIHLNHAIQYYAQKYVFKYVLLSQGANSLGLYESGCMPYQAGQIYGKRWYEVTDYLDFVWLHQLDPVYDLALDAEKLQASFVVSCSSHLTDSLSLCADLIFPNALPPEQAGTYTNYFGHQQQFESAIVPAFQTPIELFENIANDMQISLNAIDASIKPIAIEKPDIVKPLVDKHYVVKIRHWVDMDIWLREAPALKNAYPIIQGMLVHPSYQPKDQQWQQFLLPSEDVARGTSVVYRNSKADVMLHQIAKIRSSSC